MRDAFFVTSFFFVLTAGLFSDAQSQFLLNCLSIEDSNI